ncbi:MAG TPA: hypothetical protein GXX40_05750 [Firmicutes bacterium]|nr:hypothetical protein [Bacillota bacterium]
MGISVYPLLDNMIVPSNLLIASADSERGTSSSSYIKVKEIRVLRSGIYRVSFGIRSDTSGTYAYGRIYKNGVAYGTEWSVGASGNLITETEDLAFTAGDLVQLYLRRSGSSGGAWVGNFRLYGTPSAFLVGTNAEVITD